MKYYSRPTPPHGNQIWQIDDTVALRQGISNPENGPGCYFQAEPGENIWDAIRRQATGWFGPNGENPFVLLTIEPGHYYPRIARPIDQHPQEAPGWSPCAQSEKNEIAVARAQLHALVGQLDRICQTVHPSTENLNVFGHDIRNLLILACTEVEAHWKGVLIANGVAPEHAKSTNSYVKLQQAMRLGEYGVVFPKYPWIEPIHPFRDWNLSPSPTETISWYAAYHGVKHNREQEFYRASLTTVFEAVTACAVMLAAQYGHLGMQRGSELSNFFHFAVVPNWPPEQVYTYPYHSGDWQSVRYPF